MDKERVRLPPGSATLRGGTMFTTYPDVLEIENSSMMDCYYWLEQLPPLKNTRQLLIILAIWQRYAHMSGANRKRGGW